MNNTPEQYELNVLTLRQFEDTFQRIKTEVVLPDPWEGMTIAIATCAKNLKAGQVVKATTRAWRGNNSTDSKLIVIGTPAGPLALFQVTQGSSTGKPSIEERTFIQPHIPSGIYGLITKRVHNPLNPRDLTWLVDPREPENDNIGLLLTYFMCNLAPGHVFKQEVA